VKEWREFYSNGRLKEVTNYKVLKRKNYANDVVILGMKEMSSVPHGKFESYSHLDYQLKGKGTFKKGLKHGTFVDYYPGGEVPTVISQYKNGKLHGRYKQYTRTGQLQHEISYKEGLKHGPFIMYDKNGKEIVNKMFRYGREMQKLEKPLFMP
jgi:antitoxin component YwqK of YwqJK toxin-antitoxin module